jgi:all-trans-retinol 13,14-reductase
MTAEHNYDVIVIGSGMGGMSTATALSRMGRKVLLLEQ